MLRSALILFALLCTGCGDDSSESSNGGSGGTAAGGGGTGGGAALEPECECAGECLSADEVATVPCAESTVTRAPAGADCSGLRYQVQGADYAVYYFYSESGELLRTERAMAGQDRCESGEQVEPCADSARFTAEQCLICDGAGIGNPGDLPACE